MGPIPSSPPANGHALIDTGADVTCIDAGVIRKLGLSHRGMTIANVPAVAGISYAMQYEISLTILHPSKNAQHNLVIGDLIVMELTASLFGFEVLMGRDVLASCEFLYNGRGNHFRLSY